MGLAIILRKDAKRSYFRENLLNLIQTPGTNRLLLCSGYISEGKYSILNDGLIQAMLKGCVSKGSEIALVAGRFYGPQAASWIKKYGDFVRKAQTSGLRVVPYVSPKGEWHAKIAMKLNDNSPMAAIIGSSNLTGPAYRERYWGYSHECDVVMWRNNPVMNGYFGDWIRRERDSRNPFSPIETDFNRESHQPMEGERMDALYREVMNMDDLEDFNTWKGKKGYT